MSQLPREPKVPSWHNTAASEAFAILSARDPGVAVNELPDPMSSNNQTPPRLFPQTI